MCRDSDEAQLAAAIIELDIIAKTLERYRIVTGKYPTTEQGLAVLTTAEDTSASEKFTYLSEIPNDPWDNVYIYRRASNPSAKSPFELYSTGPNMIDEQGEGDDLKPEDEY